MIGRLATCALALLVCAGVEAATISTTMTVNATGSLSGTSITATGTATFTNGIGNGTFSGTVSLTPDSSGNFSAPFTITLTSGDKINGTLKIPATALTASGGTATATITGGTGVYANATGSFTLTGTGSLGLTLTLTFTGPGTITTGGGGGTGGSPTPTITAVQDAASNTPTIAQGSIFIVKGSNLSPAGVTSFPPPRPTSSSGIKVTFTPVSGGTGTDAYLVYLYNQSNVNQIACILPSTVGAGTYNVTVTNGTASSGFPAQVVANKFALFTQDSTGTGLASAQNYISQAVVDLNRLTSGSVSGVTYSPAHPGQAVIAYGTGLGPYADGDNTASPAFDFSKTLSIQAVVGGVSIPVAYAGRAGYAGEDQINFTLPANIPTGCAVSFQISVNGKLSPPTSISIAPDPNASACVMSGFSSSQLQQLDQGGTITTGGFSISQFTISTAQGSAKSNTIGGGFSQLTAFQLSSASQINVSVIQTGSCQIIQASGSGTTTAVGGSLTYLDAGNVTVTGPTGSNLSSTALTKTNNLYSLGSFEGISIPGQSNFTLPAGTYTLTGAGGADIGSFNTSLGLASALTVTGGLPSNISRSNDLKISWTGGNASDLVEIVGSTSSTTGSGASAVTSTAEFICLTTAGAGAFTVPASVLGQMYATNQGSIEVASGNVSNTFTTTLKSNGSNVPGIFASFIGTGGTASYQ